MSAMTMTAADLLGRWRGDRLSGTPPVTFPTTSFPTLDLRPGRLALVGGGPGAGKTTAAVQATTEALARTPTLKAVVGNVEMPPAVLLDKIVSRLAGVPLTALDGRALTADQRKRVETTLDRCGDLWPRLAFLAPPFTVPRLVRAAEGFGAGLIVMDYVQRFVAGAPGGDARAELDGLMAAVRRVCDAGAAFLCVAAVGRQKGAKGGSSYSGLNLASFRGSSELEYGADQAFILDRAPDRPELVRLRCEKSRYGEPRDALLRFDRAVQSFSTCEVLDAFGPAGGEG